MPSVLFSAACNAGYITGHRTLIDGGSAATAFGQFRLDSGLTQFAGFTKAVKTSHAWPRLARFIIVSPAERGQYVVPRRGSDHGRDVTAMGGHTEKIVGHSGISLPPAN